MKSDAKRLLTAFLVLAAIFSGCKTAPPPEPISDQSELTLEQQRLLNEIMGILDTTISKTGKKLESRQDPTSPMISFLEDLKEKKAYIKEIESGKVPYNAERLADLKDEIRSIRVNIENPVERVLKADITFGLGKYEITDLSEKGRKVLGEFTREVIEVLVKKQRQLFPEKIPVVFIRAIGYADEAAPGPNLARELEKSIGKALPADPIEARKERNIELSRRRAGAIAEYVVKQLKSSLGESSVRIGGPEIFGMGEAYPYPETTVSPPYAPIDKRRRVCKIHGNVLVNRK